MLLLAAAVGLIMGVGVTARVNLARPDDVEIVSSTTLTALPGETGEGQAELVRDQGSAALRIQVEGSAPSSEYREVWLINNDGKRMYSSVSCPRRAAAPIQCRPCSETRWTVSRSSMSPWSRTTATRPLAEEPGSRHLAALTEHGRAAGLPGLGATLWRFAAREVITSCAEGVSAKGEAWSAVWRQGRRRFRRRSGSAMSYWSDPLGRARRSSSSG